MGEFCAAQGRGIAAIVLSVLHVLAYYVADSIIMAEVRLLAVMFARKQEQQVSKA